MKQLFYEGKTYEIIFHVVMDRNKYGLSHEEAMRHDMAAEYAVVEEPLASAGIIVFAKYDKDSHWIENPWSTRFLIRELLQRAAMAGVGLPRVLKLHHPTGHAYWSAGEYGVQMPNGSFYNKRQHATDIPAYAKDDEKYTSPHKIEERPDGIYYIPCACGSGFGKVESKVAAIKIVDASEYDKVEYVGAPLVISPELQNDLTENAIN